ncbi:MAG: hypothetical protein FWD34_01810 [Oscillospiraceae bacterium]|nr:hypothetical protein [Oscillospiraceae bacterium]
MSKQSSKNVTVNKERYLGSVKFFKNMIVLFVILLVVGLSSALVYFAVFKNDDVDDGRRLLLTDEIVDGRGIVAVPNNISAIIEHLEEPVVDGYYLTTMNADWHFDTWNTPSSNAYVENAIENTRTVYFDLFLDETEELIYSSPFIPVGAKWERFALDKEIPVGVHSATVTYHLVDDEFQSITTVSVAVQLNINR